MIAGDLPLRTILGAVQSLLGPPFCPIRLNVELSRCLLLTRLCAKYSDSYRPNVYREWASVGDEMNEAKKRKWCLGLDPVRTWRHHICLPWCLLIQTSIPNYTSFTVATVAFLIFRQASCSLGGTSSRRKRSDQPRKWELVTRVSVEKDDTGFISRCLPHPHLPVAQGTGLCTGQLSFAACRRLVIQ